jgi:hypothetical protein
VRLSLQAKSSHWYSRKEALSRLSGEEVWSEGFSSGLFIESEKRVVYEDQNSLQELIREEQEEAAKRSRRNFEIAQYNKHVARGRQLASPAPILQPFAFAALGPLVGAAYAGTQTGAIAGEAYNACAHGTAAECAAAIAKGGAAVVVHRVTRGKRQTTTPLPSTGPTAKPDFVITRPPKLDPQTGKIKTSMIQTASGKHFDAEVDPKTGIGQIVDRASRQVVGIIRNGEVTPPAATNLPSAKSPPTNVTPSVPPTTTTPTVTPPTTTLTAPTGVTPPPTPAKRRVPEPPAKKNQPGKAATQREMEEAAAQKTMTDVAKGEKGSKGKATTQREMEEAAAQRTVTVAAKGEVELRRFPTKDPGREPDVGVLEVRADGSVSIVVAHRKDIAEALKAPRYDHASLASAADGLGPITAGAMRYRLYLGKNGVVESVEPLHSGTAQTSELVGAIEGALRSKGLVSPGGTKIDLSLGKRQSLKTTIKP